MEGLAFNKGSILGNHHQESIRNKKWDIQTCGKILFLGNSYSKDQTPWDKWPDIVANILNLGVEGTNWWNLGYPGYAMTTGEFLSQLQNWAQNNPSELQNIGAVICVAGLNDSTPNAYQDIPTAISNLVTFINSNLPNSSAYFGYTGFINQAVNMWSHPSTDEYRFYAMQKYIQCEKYGATYLSGVENLFHDKRLLDSDGIHPNAAGSRVIAEGVVNALLQGYAPYYDFSGHESITATSGAVTGYIDQYVIDGVVSTICNFKFNWSSVTPHVEFTTGSEIVLGTVNLPFTNGLEAAPVLLHVYAYNSGNISVNGVITVDKLTNEIKLRIGVFSDGEGTREIAQTGDIVSTTTLPLYKDMYTTV